MKKELSAIFTETMGEVIQLLYNIISILWNNREKMQGEEKQLILSLYEAFNYLYTLMEHFIPLWEEDYTKKQLLSAYISDISSDFYKWEKLLKYQEREYEILEKEGHMQKQVAHALYYLPDKLWEMFKKIALDPVSPKKEKKLEHPINLWATAYKDIKRSS